MAPRRGAAILRGAEVKSKGRMASGRAHQGFTLVEVLVAAFIFISVVLVAISLFSTTLGAKSRSAVLRKVNSEGRLALETLIREVRLSGCPKEDRASGCPFEIQDSAGFAIDEGVRLEVFSQDGSTKSFFLKTEGQHKSLAKESGGIIRDITSSEVEISQLLFAKIAGPEPGVKISLTVSHPGGRRVAQAQLVLESRVVTRDLKWLGGSGQ